MGNNEVVIRPEETPLGEDGIRVRRPPFGLFGE